MPRRSASRAGVHEAATEEAVPAGRPGAAGVLALHEVVGKPEADETVSAKAIALTNGLADPVAKVDAPRVKKLLGMR